MKLNKIITNVETEIEKYGGLAKGIMDNAIPIKFSSEDPFKAQQNVLKATKVQELSSEYMKLLAQLRCVRTAHVAAAKAGFEENA